MPGDLFSGMTQEIGCIELIPELFVSRFVDSVIKHQVQCFVLALLDDTLRWHLSARQKQSSGLVEQSFQKLSFPGIPDFWTGAPDICHRQQIKCSEVTFVPDDSCEGGNDIRIRNVLFLSDIRHHQVMANQPDDKFGVFGG